IDSWNRGRQVDNFDAYVWTISRNVLNRAIRRKHRITYIELAESYCAEDNALQNCLTQEEHALLRREIGLLSSVYRNAVVQYYYEGKTVREIASIHSVSEGTVKWWLFEARKQLRKGVETMRQNGEKSFNPGRLNLAINGVWGENGKPIILVNRNLLAQNILLAAYEKPVEEVTLSQELGVSRPYVENEVEQLIAAELLRKVKSGTFQTDFVIRDREMFEEGMQIVEGVYAEIREELDGFIEDQVAMLAKLPTNPESFTVERLRWIVPSMVMEIVSRTTFPKIIQHPPAPERPGLGRWIALGFANSKDWSESLRYSFNGVIGGDYDGYGYRLLLHQFSGLDLDETGIHLLFSQYYPNINNCLGQTAFLLCVNLANGRLDEKVLGIVEKEALAESIRWHLIVREDGRLKSNYLFLPVACLGSIVKSCEQFGERLIEPFRRMVLGVNDVVSKRAPEHVQWQVPTFNHDYYTKMMPMLLDDYYKEGRLSEPREEDKYILSFYIWG
ncbi:MAG: sigma-70 family RNA polymerase sigma factor, partial [Armatimonadota bacterium]